MFARLTVLGIGSVACSIYAYRSLEYHYVAPMSTSKNSTKEYIPIPISAQNTLNYHTYNQILSQYVENGKVNYIQLRKSMMRNKKKDSLFIQWLHVLAKVGPESTPNLFTDKNEQLKFYMNAYNALTIYGVIYHSFYYKNNHSLISSVKNVQSRLEPVSGWGFFKAPLYALDGNTVSLYNLEQDIIRGKFADARIHCAINCASIGCPELKSFVVDVEDLDDLSVEFVNEGRNVNIDKINKKIKLSQIFEWYKEDFELFYDNKSDGNKGNGFEANKLLYFIWNYSNCELRNDVKLAMKEKYEIEYIPYDWNLNNDSAQL